MVIPLNKLELSLELLLQTALSMFYHNDSYLLDIKCNERSCVFRFAFYFQTLLNMHKGYREYDLEIEYNRNDSDPKRNNSNDNIYPDVILHRRGTKDCNLLVIEFKGYWNRNGQNEDYNKISEMINTNGPLKYKKGYLVLLGLNDFEIKKVIQ